MITHLYVPETNIAEIESSLLQIANNPKVESILILSCDSNTVDKRNAEKLFGQIAKPLFGGSFPGIIYQDKKYELGFIIVGFKEKAKIKTVENLSAYKTNYISELLIDSDYYEHIKSLFVFVDGLTSNIKGLIEGLFTVYGLKFNYIGGGAGSLSLKQKPCLFTNSGVIEDAAILAGFEMDSNIGVKHGWGKIAGPFKVTNADANVVKSIDYKPALNVYKEIVENHANTKINTAAFFDVAKSYPLGISKFDTESVVRDPIALDDENNLICVGEVEQGSFIDILNGNKNTLVNAAKQAAEGAANTYKNTNPQFAFFVDCISRVLFLEKDFDKELIAVKNASKNTPLLGILSIGEIANNKQDYLEFFNKTSVIGYF